MHFYKFNIADYKAHTSHLSPIEDICYRRMLDWQYLHEKPLPNDINQICRLLILNDCSTPVQQVLNEFFKHVEDGYINVRAFSEIEAYKEDLDNKSKAGKASAASRKRKIQQSFNVCSTDVQQNTNHKPLNNKQLKSKGSRLSKDWILTDEYIQEAKKINTALTDHQIKTIAQGFKDYWISLAGAKGVKLDWLATWRNWIRNQKDLPKVEEVPDWKRKML